MINHSRIFNRETNKLRCNSIVKPIEAADSALYVGQQMEVFLNTDTK